MPAFDQVFENRQCVAAAVVDHLQAGIVDPVADALELRFVQSPPQVGRDQHAAVVGDVAPDVHARQLAADGFDLALDNTDQEIAQPLDEFFQPARVLGQLVVHVLRADDPPELFLDLAHAAEHAEVVGVGVDPIDE